MGQNEKKEEANTMHNDEMILARFNKRWDGFSLDVDLALPGKGVTALFGHSGSGKTTLLRAIAGLGEKAHGQCIFKGEVWQNEKKTLPAHQRAIGYVFQDANLFPHLSVRNNLKYGMTRTKAKQTIALDHAIELLGIEHLLTRKPNQLSGGEKQRVGIARALAVSPELLLMDEPLAALDLARKREILPYLEKLHKELHIPVLYVSHAPDEVARLADHIVVLSQGKAIADGPLTDILSRIDLPIKLGEDTGVVLNSVISERDQQWQLIRVTFPGGELWTKDTGKPVGEQVRVRVLARDVSISLQKQNNTSIQNHLVGVVESVHPDEHPGLLLVRVRVGDSLFVSRLTNRSAYQLNMSIGQSVWIQVKSVALIE